MVFERDSNNKTCVTNSYHFHFNMSLILLYFSKLKIRIKLNFKIRESITNSKKVKNKKFKGRERKTRRGLDTLYSPCLEDQ